MATTSRNTSRPIDLKRYFLARFDYQEATVSLTYLVFSGRTRSYDSLLFPIQDLSRGRKKKTRAVIHTNALSKFTVFISEKKKLLKQLAFILTTVFA